MTTASLPQRPVVLCILDGWGYRDSSEDNAITCAQTPNYTAAWNKSPHALLDASEEFVGLPKGQIGNSEVGHMNLGAGRVVFQDLPMIDRSIARGEMATLASVQKFIAALKASKGTAHLMGLASPGGVHSQQAHMIALAKILADHGIPVAFHAFLDGRDVPPQSAAEHIATIQEALKKYVDVRIATVCGRFFAMDRDKRWERIEKAYALLTEGIGAKATDAVAAIKASYAADKTDEFVEPIALDGYMGMNDGDGLLFANYRTDRAREILQALLDPSFKDFTRSKTINFAAATGMVEYSDHLNTLMDTLYPPKQITNSLGEIISKAGLKQLRIAETEKYPHVTFFFNGGREQPYEGEERILVASPKVATYDLQPEMSAPEVTDKVVAAIESGAFDLIILNYANPDMVGHTGILKAAIKAVETVDACLGRLFAAVRKQNGLVLVTADHGNCDIMFDPTTNGPHTAHTLSRVPVMLVGGSSSITKLKDGKLADVAPTLLALMSMDKPADMDGESLIA